MATEITQLRKQADEVFAEMWEHPAYHLSYSERSNEQRSEIFQLESRLARINERISDLFDAEDIATFGSRLMELPSGRRTRYYPE